MSGQRAIEILQSVFGFPGFREGQDQAIEAVLDDRHVLAVMPTGAGKSLCFQVPALVKGGLTVVISPLVALMQNQVAILKLSGVKAVTINSGQSRDENVAAWRAAASGEANLLYLSPERLMTERMIAALKKLSPGLIAIDEAHCISQWGPAFRPEYEDLKHLKNLFPDIPIIALTATADPLTREHIADKLFDRDAEIIVTGFDRPNLHLTVEMKVNWKKQLLNFLEGRDNESGIIYCLSRKKTEETAQMLQDQGYNALAYHAGMDQESRTVNQDRFITEPGIIMVATIAFGMGIDKPDIRFVFHTDLPGSPEAYYQEIGRAGRDRNEAVVHMLYGLDDIRMRRTFIENEGGGEERARREHQRLDALLAYCEAPECRRRTLLDYFGEQIEACGKCDCCNNPAETVEGDEVGRVILGVVEATGQRYGAGHIVDVITGKSNEKILQMGHDSLSAYGSGKAHKAPQWRGIIRQLVAAGFLAIDIRGYGALVITDKGRALVKGDTAFRYRLDVVQDRAKTSRVARASRPAIEVNREAEGLLQHLKELRLQFARERNVPAYVIFTDRTLIDMANKRPQSTGDFAKVHGVGEAKLRDFAPTFIEAITHYQSMDAIAIH
ncbi:DNA helicase RecQ [Aestuariispira insulae]|uniref:DNA helicase RecQ n=1 Tax=Aestuariispira insulae TaxID=1461337 RepID=A0A3D9HXL9_9PROT|nr:DNA helicase RecQ [Aestuariispira insulae]RED54155.1 ATP-dependent DNA helicase RecQ [Aestuariispira insulae]